MNNVSVFIVASPVSPFHVEIWDYANKIESFNCLRTELISSLCNKNYNYQSINIMGNNKYCKQIARDIKSVMSNVEVNCSND